MNTNKLPIALFNGAIATTNGVYRICDIDVDDARRLVKDCPTISGIGHEATAEVMTQLLGVEVPFNRIQFKQEVTQIAIVLKLNERPVEGVVLSREQIEKVGYCLKLMERLE